MALAPRCQCHPWTLLNFAVPVPRSAGGAGAKVSVSAVDRSRGRTHHKFARVCPLQFWCISAIFLQILASVFLFLVFSICQECGTECGPDSLQIRPDFSLCSFGAFLRIFCRFLRVSQTGFRVLFLSRSSFFFHFFLVSFVSHSFHVWHVFIFPSLCVLRDFFQVLLL